MALFDYKCTGFAQFRVRSCYVKSILIGLSFNPSPKYHAVRTRLDRTPPGVAIPAVIMMCLEFGIRNPEARLYFSVA